MLSVKLPEELDNRLSFLARATGRTKSWYVRRLLEDHLEDMEDAFLADAAIARLREGKTRTCSMKEVMDDLGVTQEDLSNVRLDD